MTASMPEAPPTAAHLVADPLACAMSRTFNRLGVGLDDAEAMARALVQTSLLGIDTHGIRVFPLYCRELAEGRAACHPDFRVGPDNGAALHLDCGDAPGLLAGLRAARLAGDRAKRQGVGLVLASRSNHFGAASVYALALAERGLLGLVMTHAAARVGAAAGGPPTLGTNPICFAAPRTGGHPFLFDMATSQVAYCRVKAEQQAGRRLPDGWCFDAHGDDAARTGQPPAALQPLGGYKGQGLGLMVSMLTGMLAGAIPDWQLSHLDCPPYDTPRGIAHCIIAIDPNALGLPGETCARRVADYLAGYRDAAGDLARLPGDAEWACHDRRLQQGIPITAAERTALEAWLGPLPQMEPHHA